LSVSINHYCEIHTNANNRFLKVVHRMRSWNDPCGFETVDHLLVKFEPGFLNPGRTVTDPLTVSTLPNISSQPSRVRLRRASEANRRKSSHLRTIRRARSIGANPRQSRKNWHSTRILWISNGQGYQVSAIKSSKLILHSGCFSLALSTLIEFPNNKLLAELLA